MTDGGPVRTDQRTVSRRRPGAVFVDDDAASALDLGKSAATRARILAAAAGELRTRGYAATRLTDIAARIGMKAGSLYYHFPSREALVEAVMMAGLELVETALHERLASLPADATALEAIEAAIETHVVVLLAHNDLASATIKLIWQVPPDIRARVVAAQRTYGATWRRLLTAGRDAGAIRADLDLSVVRMGLLGALNWTVDWYRPGGAAPKRIARDITRMVLGGLAASRRETTQGV